MTIETKYYVGQLVYFIQSIGRNVVTEKVHISGNIAVGGFRIENITIQNNNKKTSIVYHGGYNNINEDFIFPTKDIAKFEIKKLLNEYQKQIEQEMELW